MLQPNGSISVFDSLTRLLSYITACLRFGIYTSTSKVKTLFCCLSTPPPGDFGEGVGNHRFRKLRPGLRPPIGTGRLSCRVRKRERLLRPHLHIWPLTYQHGVHTRSFLIISTSRGCLVCKSVYVCVYLCTISELSSVGFLIYKASFQPVLRREGDFLWLSQWHVKSVV